MIRRLGKDGVVLYGRVEKGRGKRGDGKWYDGKVEFGNVDVWRCEEIEVEKGGVMGVKGYWK